MPVSPAMAATASSMAAVGNAIADLTASDSHTYDPAKPKKKFRKVFPEGRYVRGGVNIFMAIVSPTSAGLVDLVQALKNSGSTLISSAQSVSALRAALQNDPPEDTVQLGNVALQLQEADELFGIASAPSANPVVSALNSAASTAGTDTDSTADQMATIQREARANQIAALLGNSAPAVSGNLLNTVA